MVEGEQLRRSRQVAGMSGCPVERGLQLCCACDNCACHVCKTTRSLHQQIALLIGGMAWLLDASACIGDKEREGGAAAGKEIK